MAILNKTVTCAFCGKEMTNGFMKKESHTLEICDYVSVHCCPDCFTDKREAMSLMYKETFSAKVDNCAWVRHKLLLKDAEIIKMYESFCEERYALDMKYLGIQPTGQGEFYRYDNEGHFTWREQKVNFIVSDKDKAMSTIKNQFGSVFSKNDLGFIRFRISNRKELEPFVQNYTLEICVNDLNTVTGKPQYARTEFVIRGMPFTAKKRGLIEARRILEQFCRNIGCNLPIEEVKSFR